MTDVQHCRTCATEYVAGITICADCGAPLVPGPLPQDQSSTPDPEAAATEGPPRSDQPPDSFLTELPGLQAEHTTKLLTLEGITCLLECQGFQQLRYPNREPNEPFAVTMSVSIYVPQADLEAAQEILGSFNRDDLIGDQWRTGEDAVAVTADHPAQDDEHASTHTGDVTARRAKPEGTFLRLVLLLVAVGLLFFMFRR